VFSAAGMRPGERVGGSVRIGNGGDVRGRFSLGPSGLRDEPGPGGARLSDHLQLVVVDVTDPQRPSTVYAGSVRAFAGADIGLIDPLHHRDLRFAATLPGSAGNELQGAAMSVGFEWRASPAPLPTTPAPTPAPKPRPPLTGSALADALGLPSARRCVKRRRGLRIDVRAPRGTRLASAKVRLNGKIRARPKRPRTVVLRRLPKHRLRVWITVRTTDGGVYHSSRAYRVCAPRRR
jgi:hypothetical protein